MHAGMRGVTNDLPVEPEAQSRDLTLDEAIAIAILLQKSEQLAQAEALYRWIFDTAPDHPEALHFAGVLAQQRGRSDEAVTLMERSLALEPGRADWHSNLGIAYQAQARVDEAIAAFSRAIELDPEHANAHSNLGVLLRATEKPVEAEQAYRAAIRVAPDHIDAHTNLGVLLTSLKRNEEAVACFCKALTLRPKHPDARKLLALAHATIGEVDEAIRIFEDWLIEEPANPVARHMLAACTGIDVPARASNAFVTDTFASFAASFEAKLARLSYRAPALVVAMLADACVAPSRDLDVLDAGCGTGLCGPLLAPYARRLCGMDLSAAMLVHAEAKHVYDELAEGELTEYLDNHPATFDLIVSADTLVYFGKLDDALAAATRALRPGGVLVFTLEHAVGSTATGGYRLELHGRYSHSRDYVEELLRGLGLAPKIVEADLRMESGAPVQGLVIRARKRRRVERHAA
jgi:predicted TPR repeat methyltransferase